MRESTLIGTGSLRNLDSIKELELVKQLVTLGFKFRRAGNNAWEEPIDQPY